MESKYMNNVMVDEPGRSLRVLGTSEIEQVSGGFLHWLFPAAAVDATFGDSMRKLSDAMGGSTQVVAGPNGEGCTTGIPDSIF